MATTRRGTLGKFLGSWSSGLGFLEIDGHPIPCENALTVRALDACFGDVIQLGHAVSSEGFEGREVVYSVDDLGLLLGFTPIEEWAGPEIVLEGQEEG